MIVLALVREISSTSVLTIASGLIFSSSMNMMFIEPSSATSDPFITAPLLMITVLSPPPRSMSPLMTAPTASSTWSGLFGVLVA